MLFIQGVWVSFFTPCRQASSKGLLGKLCTWRPGSRSNRHNRNYMPLDRRMATKQVPYAERRCAGDKAPMKGLTQSDRAQTPVHRPRALELHTTTVDLAAARCQRRTRTSSAFCISSKVAPSATLEKTICALAAALSAVSALSHSGRQSDLVTWGKSVPPGRALCFLKNKQSLF